MTLGEHDSLIHPQLSFSFSIFVVGMAATMAVITGLCGFIRRKTPSSPEIETGKVESAIPNPSAEVKPEEDVEAAANIPLPPPPAMRELRESYSSNLMSRSETKMIDIGSISSSNLNTKVPSTPKPNKVKTDDNSLLTKTIIKGEKCRIRDDEDNVEKPQE